MPCTTRSPILFACLALMTAARAAPPKPDMTNLPGYIKALNRSQDPQAAAIRREIADGPAALARERAAAQAEGIALDAAQLQRPLPPPDRNAAPLYQQLDALRHDKPLHLPPYAQPLNGNYAYTPAQLAAVQAIIDSRRDVFDLLHQAAGRPECVFTRDWAAGDAVLFPELAGLREDARELNTESYLLAHRGDYADAIATQALGFGIARHAASDPTLINYLVAVAIDAIALNGMKQIMLQAGPDAAVDARVQEVVARDRPTLSARYALSGEAAMFLTTMGPLQSADPAKLLASFALGPGHPRPLTPAEARTALDLLSAEEARYLSDLRPLLAAADAPPRAVPVSAAPTTSDAPEQSLDPVTALENILMPAYGKVGETGARAGATAQAVMAGAALLAARARTGAFPAALPGDFPDPFTGKPLGYRREGPYGFVVYSVGPDGTFDGGKPGEYHFVPSQALFRYPGPPLQPVR